MASNTTQAAICRSGTVERQAISRNWADLDANTQGALDTTTALIAEQMRIYDREINNAH